MDKFTVIHIFMKFLKRADYQNKKAFSQPDFERTLTILDKDRDKIFQIMYGDKIIEGRGDRFRGMFEWKFRLLEAEEDVRKHYIANTMHYLLTQIINQDLKFE